MRNGPGIMRYTDGTVRNGIWKKNKIEQWLD